MKPVDVASIPVELAQRIQRDLQAHFKLVALPTATAAWQIVNPYSLVLCIEWRSGEWRDRVFVKLPLGPVEPAVAAKYRQPENSTVLREFNVLRELEPLNVAGPAGAAACTVVALSCYIDLFALATLDAGGHTLRVAYTRHARFWTMPTARSSLIKRVELCGQWLRLLHDSTAKGHESFDIDELRDYCRVRLDKLRQLHPHVLSHSETEGLMTAISRFAARIPSGSVRVSGRHNDFASHNIIARPDGGIRVLDFTMYDKGPNAFDVCNFWFELEMLKCDPSYSRAILSDAQRMFLASYGGISADSPDFALARLRYALNRLLNVLGDKSLGSTLTLHRTFNVRAIRRWLSEIAQ